MELEDVHSDLCSLRKLYGLLQNSQDGVQVSGILDERARGLLKSLLDAATEKALLAYSKIIAAAQSSVFSNPHSSQAVKPKNVPYLEPPISSQFVGASSRFNAKTNFCTNMAWNDEQSVITPTPQDAGSEHSRLTGSLCKPESRKKRCQVCKQTSMKLQNSVKDSDKDGYYRDGKHDEAHSINGNAKGLLKIKLKGLKSAATCSEEPRQKRSENQCKPDVFPSSDDCASTSLRTGFVNSGPRFIFGQTGKLQEDTGSNSFKRVPNATKCIGSGTSSSLQPYAKNGDPLKANKATFDYDLSEADNSMRTKMQSIQQDGSVAMGETYLPNRQNGDSSVAMSGTNHVKRQIVKEIVERIESLNRASSPKNYEAYNAQGLQVPWIQDDMVKKYSMHSKKTCRDTPLHNPARLEKKSRPSVTSAPTTAGSMVQNHKRNLPPRPFIRPTLLDYDNHHKRSTPERSYMGSWDESDETTSLSSKPRSGKLSDETASSSCNPRSLESSDATASSSSNLPSPEESYEIVTSSPSPRSSYSWTSEQETTGSSNGRDEGSEDYYEHWDPPPREMDPSKRYRSPSPKKKATGGLRRLRNKLGLIFHHHHHHHHHENDSEKAPTKSMWKHLHKMFQQRDIKHDKVYQTKAVDNHRKTVVASNKKQQAGHFHSLVKGLMRHAKHSKKSKPSKGRIGRQIGHLQGDHDNKHWWKTLQCGRGGGVKLPNRARVRLGLPNKKKHLK